MLNKHKKEIDIKIIIIKSETAMVMNILLAYKNRPVPSSTSIYAFNNPIDEIVFKCPNFIIWYNETLTRKRRIKKKSSMKQKRNFVILLFLTRTTVYKVTFSPYVITKGITGFNL